MLCFQVSKQSVRWVVTIPSWGGMHMRASMTRIVASAGLSHGAGSRLSICSCCSVQYDGCDYILLIYLMIDVVPPIFPFESLIAGVPFESSLICLIFVKFSLLWPYVFFKFCVLLILHSAFSPLFHPGYIALFPRINPLNSFSKSRYQFSNLILCSFTPKNEVVTFVCDSKKGHNFLL